VIEMINMTLIFLRESQRKGMTIMWGFKARVLRGELRRLKNMEELLRC